MLPYGWAQEIQIDPFESVLPKEEKGTVKKKRTRKEVRNLPEWIIVEGVLWGNRKPQVIISGEVYKVGDKIKGLDADIFKIQKNNVFISYSGKIFKEKPKKGGK